MVCDLAQYFIEEPAVRREKMAQRGISDDDIKRLEAEVNLAREKAKAESYKRGDTLAQQKRAMEIAQQEAIKRVEDDLHAALDDTMSEIRALGQAMALPSTHTHGGH